jgi:RNA polymerase sigma-70 factor (ECF subfamily)
VLRLIICAMVLEESDQELIEACRRGEAQAFRALFERHKDKVFSVALRYSGDAAVAQDISQETFLKLFVGVKTFRGESDFGSWLYRLVVNSCLDQKRKTRRLMPLLDNALAMLKAPGLSAFDQISGAEMRGRLREVMADLPDRQRMLLVLRYTQALSYEEIGRILGVAGGTVASRLNRIHRTLERRLARFVGKECKKEHRNA